MELQLTTPALLFPTVSMLLLAFTNRFGNISQLVRELHSKYQKNKEAQIFEQIVSLRKRLLIIRNMQVIGVLSLFLCVFCMFLLFENQPVAAKIVFALSLVLFMLALSLSTWEIQRSTKALNIQLRDIEEAIVKGEESEETIVEKIKGHFKIGIF